MLNLTNSAIWISPQAIAAISNTTSMIPTLILNENYSDYPANEYGLLYYSNVTELLLPPPSSVMPATNVSTAKRKNATRSSATFEVPIWLIACYSVILLCAVIGNLLVISTLVQNRRMRTITNVFLLNLAISDILLGVLCMPVTLVGTLLRHFIFGEFCCKLIQFSQAASVAVSSWTLVAISCERYYAICHPLSSRRWQTRRHAYKIIACIWLGSVVCMSPIAIFSKLMPTSRQGFKKCRENWPSFALAYERPYNIFLDIILLILPLVILSIAYILITRTLYVSICMEKTMVFGSRRNDKPAHQQQQQQSQQPQHAYLPTTSHVSEEESEERDRVERIEMEQEMLCATTTAGKLSFQIGHTVPMQQHHPPETLRARLKLNLLSRFKSKTPASTTLMSTAAAAASNMFDVHLDKSNNKQQTETDVLYNEQSSQHQFSVVNHRQQYMPSRALSYSLNNNQQKLQLQQQQPNYSQQHHQYHHQHQPQQQHHHHHHHSDMPHNVENDCRTKFSCDYLMRFCCKCILPSSSLAASSSSAFPVATTPVTTSSSSSYVAREHKHLYCMRFATLKTLPNSEMGNCSMTGGYSSSGCNTSAATINGNSSNNSCGNNSEQQQKQQLSQGMATSSSTYRMQLQQQQQYHLSKSSFVQHDVSSYCCCCKDAETKRNFSTKRINLSKTSSVLRRNNIAKNLQSKKRVVKMLSVLVLEFFICWTPLYVLNTVAMYIGAAIYEYIDYTSISVLQLLAYSSSCCNPITYCFMNANFRRAFLDTFKGLHWCNLDYFKSNSKTQSKNMKQKVNLYMVDNNSSMRGNSCTVQSVIVESPRL